VLSHPYRGLPGTRFWRTSVAGVAPEALDPVVSTPFTIGRNDSVAAAGSCFAQHIARHLQQSGFKFLQTESAEKVDGPVFSAQFGNVYTVRQLRQLFERAYGLMRPADSAWKREDGRYIDPFRPQLFAAGFATPEEVEQARRGHFEAVQRMFEEAQILVFTLGLTEAWVAQDGAVLPVPPGVVATEAEGTPRFHNFTVAEMRADMDAFLANLRTVNPGIRVILTVSPVPLAATYEDRHVLVSNTYSKAALRVVAEETQLAHQDVAYFPSYEIITSPRSPGYYEADLREVGPVGVAHVMRIFTGHFMGEGSAPRVVASDDEPVVLTEELRAQYTKDIEVLCDEELLDAR
jgi:hypothetical protein